MIAIDKTSVTVAGKEDTLIAETITAFYTLYSLFSEQSKEKYRLFFLKHLFNPSEEYIEEMRKKL